MLIRQLQKIYQNELSANHPETETDAIFALVAAKWLEIKPSDVTLKPDVEIPKKGIPFFMNSLQELKSGKPIQYILKEAAFLNFLLEVNEHVLIPRPETEELVDLVLKEPLFKNKKTENVRVLDIGTGSGCIAIGIKKGAPNAIVTGVDISPKALEVATRNAQKLSLSIHFIEDNILSPNQTHTTSYDIIVSNPPYVMDSEKDKMLRSVTDFEPHQALFVADSEPLLFYKHILKFAYDNLSPEGRVFFEINPLNAKILVALANREGFRNTQIFMDMQQKERILKVWR